MDKLINTPMLTDGGLETTLIFHNNIELPHFAAFNLLNTPKYLHHINNYYRRYLEIAKKHKTGFILESATWRASHDYGYKLGYNNAELENLNILAIKQLKELKNEYLDEVSPIVISGCIGPRSDGYSVFAKMNVDEAAKYHTPQIDALKKGGADIVSALTINYPEEALGIVKAAKEKSMPVVISFTVETDGRLPSSDYLKNTILKIDKMFDHYVSYYMINCAHPSHFIGELENDSEWVKRIGGIRSNASCKSHAELDAATELDTGDKLELGYWYKKLKAVLPNLLVYGGCCGTDHTHVESICEHVMA